MENTITPEDEVIELLHRPTAGCEIPDNLRQTLLQMVRDGKVRAAGLPQSRFESRFESVSPLRYDRAIFWRM